MLPGIPHHVTQRGNRREQTFFEDGDYALYLDLLADAAGRAGVEIWSYCLMPNHVHIVAVPRDEDGLSRALRYLALNPVRARLTERAEHWRWSSTAANFSRKDDHVVKVAPAIERVGDFAAFLREPFDEAMTYAALQGRERRPSRGVSRVARGYGGEDRPHPCACQTWPKA